MTAAINYVVRWGWRNVEPPIEGEWPAIGAPAACRLAAMLAQTLTGSHKAPSAPFFKTSLKAGAVEWFDGGRGSWITITRKTS